MTDRVAIALTLWGEARGEAIEGRLAVASVLRNRRKTKRWGQTYQQVCQAPYQFSCWNAEDPNSAKLHALARTLESDESVDPLLEECLWIADGLIEDKFASRVGIATHYFAAWMPSPPKWSIGAKEVAKVGVHRFFMGVK